MYIYMYIFSFCKWCCRKINKKKEKLIFIDDFLSKVFSPKTVICYDVLEEDDLFKS